MLKSLKKNIDESVIKPEKTQSNSFSKSKEVLEMPDVPEEIEVK